MAAKDKSPPEILKLRKEMVQELGLLFAFRKEAWSHICSEVGTQGLLSYADLGQVKSMNDLFIKLIKSNDNSITDGNYDEIYDIFSEKDKEAGNIIQRFTKCIKEASRTIGKRKQRRNSETEESNSKGRKGNRKHLLDSDSETEVEDRKSKRRTGKRKQRRYSNSESETEESISKGRKGNRKHLLDSDSETEVEDRKSKRKTGKRQQRRSSQTEESNSKGRKGKRKYSIDSDSESEVQDRKSKQRKGKGKISHDSDSEAEDEKRKLTQRKGYHKHSRDSDSGREDDGSESNQRKENAGNLRKEHDDTHNARIVYTWQTAMNAVGFIQGPVARGTGFRVGKDKIMTAYHVVEEITKTHTGAKPDLSNLEKDNVFITFNFLEAINPKNTRKFYFKESFVHDKKMDFAILQLRNKDKTEESSYPEAITHFKPVYPEHTFALLGHPDGKPMQLDPKVHIFDPESDQGKRRLEEMKKWGRKQGKKSAYDNILDKNKVLFDCWVQHGASGSPGIEMGSNGEPVCSLMLIHGYPNFVFDDQHKRKEEDHPFMIEQGVTMQAIAATLNLMGKKAKATKREIFTKNVFEC